jgi:DNA helicase HerA-like ATPase
VRCSNAKVKGSFCPLFVQKLGKLIVVSTPPFLIGKGAKDALVLPKYCNHHGLIAGATGTGKTVTLQALAESLSSIGVPVFMADVKGDLAGMSQIGGGNEKLEARAKQLDLAPLAYTSFPVAFWDVFGEHGTQIRTTISEMGPLLLSQMLGLNDTQEGVLNIVFKVADDQGLLLLDLKDLREMLNWVGENAESIRNEYGNVSSASVGAVQRQLLVLEEQGAELFFGETAMDIRDLIRQAPDGKGIVNILAASKLMQSPKLYATFLLWMLSELFEVLPEAGDLDQPKLVFFFDEAHLLFSDAPEALMTKVEQVVRLIRSKGVGIFFVTQHPLDIPDSVLSQLSNRFQHALRAFTPRDQKAVKTAAETFRKNPDFDTEEVITQLGIGEALVSVLAADGTPTIVDRVFIKPPLSRLGAITPDERQRVISNSPLQFKYAQSIDRESAFEVLRARAVQIEQQQAEMPDQQRQPAGRRSDTVLEAMAKSALRAASSQLGRQIVRGVLGSIFGKRR